MEVWFPQERVGVIFLSLHWVYRMYLVVITWLKSLERVDSFWSNCFFVLFLMYWFPLKPLAYITDIDVALVALQLLIPSVALCVTGGGSRPVLPSAAPAVPSSWHLWAGLCGLCTPHWHAVQVCVCLFTFRAKGLKGNILSVCGLPHRQVLSVSLCTSGWPAWAWKKKKINLLIME